MNNDPIAEELAYACRALREDLEAEKQSSTYWYKEVQELKKELAKMNEQYKVATNQEGVS